MLKMAEELIGSLSYGAPQSDTKRQDSSNVFSLEIASYIWARFTQKNSLLNLIKKKWKNFLIIMKLNSHVRW